MNILRKKKLKKHVNTIAYISVFMIAAIIISVAVVSGKDKIEYLNEPEVETYVVDIVSGSQEKLAAIGSGFMIEEPMVTEATSEESIVETTTVEETTVPEATTQDVSSYKGIFIMNTSGNLNIRNKADTSSEVVGILTEGNGGQVVQYGKEWTKVKSGKVSGYVATEFILIGEKAKEAQKENGYTATITADTLMVREKRSTDSSVLGMAAEGEKFSCKKVYPNWIKINFEGKTGYISREFVKLDNVMTYAKSVEEIEAEQATQAPVVEQSTMEDPQTIQNQQHRVVLKWHNSRQIRVRQRIPQQVHLMMTDIC